MEKKKSIFKRWWFWVIVVLVIAGIGAVGGGEDGSEPNTAEPAATEPQAEQPKKTEEKSEPENKPTISKAEFDAIKNGMTYEEVVKIIGSEGEVMSETGEAGTDLHTIIYSWDGEGEIGANANFTFQGGKLQNKAQFGLK
ncbi:DUF3862 domain-containing protein [Aeribacillus pallidus]|nr:DUF3862 domain-containing protein [Aeribacillus pallidus]